MVVAMFLGIVLASTLMSETGLLSRHGGIACCMGSLFMLLYSLLFCFCPGNGFVLFSIMGVYRFADGRARLLLLHYGPMDILPDNLLVL